MGGFAFGAGYFGEYSAQSGNAFPNLGPLKITAETIAEGLIAGEAMAIGGVSLELDVLAAVVRESDVPT
jgi:hypothetical protein